MQGGSWAGGWPELKIAALHRPGPLCKVSFQGELLMEGLSPLPPATLRPCKDGSGSYVIPWFVCSTFMPYNVMWVGMLGSKIIKGVLLDETLRYIEICLGFIGLLLKKKWSAYGSMSKYAFRHALRYWVKTWHGGRVGPRVKFKSTFSRRPHQRSSRGQP